MTNPENTRRVLGESALLGGNLAAEFVGLISTISAVIIALQTMWACSSDGQSSGFLNRWSGVRLSPGPPFSFNSLALVRHRALPVTVAEFVDTPPAAHAFG